MQTYGLSSGEQFEPISALAGKLAHDRIDISSASLCKNNIFSQKTYIDAGIRPTMAR